MTTGTKNRQSRLKQRIRTGTKHRMRAPLLPPDAFRCAHWLATMAFINLEKKHEGSVESWARGFWYKFSKYTWEQTIVKKGTSTATGAGISIGSFAVITAVGTLVGGPWGAVIGAVIGALFAGGSALVTIGVNTVVDLAYHKYAREEIDDRLNRSDYRELHSGQTQDKSDRTRTAPGYFFEVETPISLHQLVDQLDVGPWKIWDHERNRNLREYIEGKLKPTDLASEFLIPKGKKVWIPSKVKGDPQVGDFRHNARRLTSLVKHSLRDSVVHLRKAIAIYQEMPEEITGGRAYAPGEKETFRDALKNVRSQYPKFDFPEDIDAIVYHPKNPGTPIRYVVEDGETLEQIAEKEDCPWYDILEYEDNKELRYFYIKRKLWPEKEVNRTIALEGVKSVMVPRGIIDKDVLWKHRIYNYDGNLDARIEKVPNYLPPGKPIWIPASRTLDWRSFKDCDQMIDRTQIALEFVHHLNKFRNYLLPCLNLTRLYLDIYEEFAAYREYAHGLIEEAVIEYQQFGEHKSCNVKAEWQTLAEYWEKTKHKSWANWKYWLFGPRYKPFFGWGCLRTALKEALKESGKATEYTVSDDKETFDSIAADHNISVQALVAHNYRKRKISHDSVQYSAKDQKWDVKQTSPGAGTTLSIPGSNIADRLVYSDVWGCSGIRPEHSTDQFSGDYTKNYCAGVAVAEVPLDDLKKELDEMIENYHQSLQKNRETHEQKWYDAPQERRRYFYLTQDVLHGLDFPGPGTRVKHKFDNLILRHTAGEKTLAALDAAVGVVGSMLTSAISDGVGAGTKALFPKVGVMDAVKDLFMNKPGEDFARYVSKQGINKSSSLGSEGAKALLGLGISLGGGKAESKRTENMITAAHRLNFRKERIAVAAQLTGRHDQDAEQMSLKYAAKQSEDLFFKISRHVHWAFVLLQGKLVPMMGKLENNSGEVGYGLKGCNDCAKHLKTLYEYQHQVDKAERYLVASLALVKHLFDFEGYLSTVEKEIREILDESAGGWIANGNHEKCRKFKLVGHRYCYGPGEKVASKPYRPLRQRDKSDKPARPSKEGRKPIGQLRKQPPEEE